MGSYSHLLNYIIFCNQKFNVAWIHMMRHFKTCSPKPSPSRHSVSSTITIHIHQHIYSTLIKDCISCFKRIIWNSYDNTDTKILIYKCRHGCSERTSELPKACLTPKPTFSYTSSPQLSLWIRMIWRTCEKNPEAFPGHTLKNLKGLGWCWCRWSPKTPC